MRKFQFRLIVSLICGIGLFTGSIYGGESAQSYGSKGTFEFSTGISSITTTHNASYQIYDLSVLPYANHFLFNRVFLRYEMSLGLNLVVQNSNQFQVTPIPGLGIGYNFPITEKWHVNLAAGYAAGYIFTKDATPGWWSVGVQQLFLAPELKYVITEKWVASILIRGHWNFFAGGYSNMDTKTYIVLSYLF